MSPVRHPATHRRARRRLAAAAVSVALLAGACLLTACGGVSGASPTPTSPSPTPVASFPTATVGAAPTPVPSPQITSGAPPAGAVDAVRRFWTLVGEGRLAEAKATVVAPGSSLLQWDADQDGIAAARFIRVVPDSVGRGPAEGATIEFAVAVWIEQHPDEPMLWDDLGEHQLFEHVVRMSDGTWRMWGSGTGP
jgi:hypothetical protein